MLMRFDPFRELDRLTESLTQPLVATAPMDAYRHGETFHVAIDLPGVSPSDIDLTAERNVLTVRANRVRTLPEDSEVVVSERPQGEVTRRLFLGDSLDADHIQARYENGVLHLTIPVAQQARARKIEIGAGATAPIDVTTRSEPVAVGASA
jgi:HSP20 family protein